MEATKARTRAKTLRKVDGRTGVALITTARAKATK